jgi:hypothetical protein
MRDGPLEEGRGPDASPFSVESLESGRRTRGTRRSSALDNPRRQDLGLTANPSAPHAGHLTSRRAAIGLEAGPVTGGSVTCRLAGLHSHSPATGTRASRRARPRCRMPAARRVSHRRAAAVGPAVSTRRVAQAHEHGVRRARRRSSRSQRLPSASRSAAIRPTVVEAAGRLVRFSNGAMRSPWRTATAAAAGLGARLVTTDAPPASHASPARQ